MSRERQQIFTCYGLLRFILTLLKLICLGAIGPLPNYLLGKTLTECFYGRNLIQHYLQP